MRGRRQPEEARIDRAQAGTESCRIDGESKLEGAMPSGTGPEEPRERWSVDRIMLNHYSCDRSIADEQRQRNTSLRSSKPMA